MGVAFKRNKAVLSEVVGAEEAETLLEWLQKHPKAKVDLAAVSHLHPANLQVLLAARPALAAGPADPGLAQWLAAVLAVGS